MSPDQPQQMTAAEAFNQSLILFQASQIAAAVHLSATKSVNLSKVARYESVELMDEIGEGKNVKQVAFDPPKFAPALYFEGSDDPFFLEDDENEIFRPVWERHAHLTEGLYRILDGLFPQPPPQTPEAV